MEKRIDQKPDNKHTNTVVMVVLLILFALGLMLVLASTEIGMKIAHTEVLRNGGSMDTAMYQFILSNAAQSYRLVGAILAFITGIGALLTGFVDFQKRNH